MSIMERSDKLLTRNVVAKRMNVHPKTIGRWEARGTLPAIKVNARVTRYRLEDVERLIMEGYVK